MWISEDETKTILTTVVTQFVCQILCYFRYARKLRAKLQYFFELCKIFDRCPILSV